jgi:hypothetical protein
LKVDTVVKVTVVCYFAKVWKHAIRNREKRERGILKEITPAWI